MAMPMAIAAFLACGRAGWRRLLRLGDINPGAVATRLT